MRLGAGVTHQLPYPTGNLFVGPIGMPRPNAGCHNVSCLDPQNVRQAKLLIRSHRSQSFGQRVGHIGISALLPPASKGTVMLALAERK